MRVKNEDLLNGGTADLSADWASRGIWVGHILNYAIQLVCTGSPVGTFKLQGSVDTGPSESDVIHWTDVGNSSQAISAAGNHMWEVEDCGYTWVRVIYTRTSGTGTITSAKARLKGL